jgi:type IV pilus assembly protein PilO
MNLQDVNWEPSAAGTWPKYVKISIIIIVCVLVAVIWYYFDTLEQWESYKKLEKKELTLKKQFENKQKKAVNLPAYRGQLTQIEASLDEMLRQLPTKQEVASLLIDISQTGLASGLEFRLFKPAGLVQRDFYSELPINITVEGKFEEFGLFISGLASLPRIVTVHNVNMKPDKSGKLQMNALVKTYSDTISSAQIGKKRKKGKGRK